MERITIDITGMGNAAFGDDFHDKSREVARILHKIASRFEDCEQERDTPEFCHDLNGNRVAVVTVD